ncbi:MAG: AsmA-like C-terminal region-containing protein [Sphingobacteriaceae bacterium]
MSKAKKILLWTLIITTLIVVQGFIVMFVYQDEIKNLAVKELNKQLNTPIKVGKIDFSLFEHFPFAAISFPDVEMKESNNQHQNNLVQAKDISLLFNVWDLVNKNYHIKKLYLADAHVNIVIDSLGNPNYSIWKASQSSDEAFQFSIDKIRLKNTSVSFKDIQNKKIINLLVKDGELSGDFTEKEFELKAQVATEIEKINFNGNNYLLDKKAEIATEVLVNLNQSIFEIKKLHVELPEITLDSKGKITYSEKIQNILLNVKGSEMSIQSFISLLPKAQQNKLKDYQSTGDFYFDADIKGSIGPKKVPSIKIKAGIKNGSVTIENEKIKKQKIENVDLNVEFTNGSSTSLNSAILQINKFNGTLDANPISAKASIRNFNNPSIFLTLATSASLKKLAELMPDAPVKFTNGSMSINVNLNGLWSDFSAVNNIEKTNANGYIVIKDAAFQLPNSSLVCKNGNGNFSFEKNDLKINQLNAQLGSSDLALQGYFRNLLGFLLFPDQSLQIDAQLKANKINLAELISSTPTNNTQSEYLIKLNPKLSCNLKVDINELIFQKFKANDIGGNIQIGNQQINTDYLSFRAQDGLVFTKIKLDASLGKPLSIDADVNLKKINITKFFYEFEEFGLEIIQSKNLKGLATASIKVHSIWDKYLAANTDALTAEGPILIENGELINFEPMLALSKFIDVNELKNLKFASLANTLSIKNRIVTIPAMQIQSNALNLDFAGTHNFDNIIDYRLKILLSDLIKKKSKRLGDEQFGELEDDGRGKTILYIKMYGDAENPKFNIDKIGIKKKLADDLKKEGKAVKQVLKDEFNSWFDKEAEFKEQQQNNAADWEKDIPGLKSSPQNTKTDSTKKKSNLQRLKEKLKEQESIEQP